MARQAPRGRPGWRPRARPGATFVQADLTALELDAGSFDAVVALYSVIHVPLDAQPALLAAFARWLSPGGVLLMTAGSRAWTGTETGWLGGTATMWWSHADAATYRGWLGDAGLRVEDEAFVPEGDGGHSLFWAVRAG
ncbi:MAG TPA: class I SAM-dependent methyltransferase [Jatrophihabitans sp.]